MKKDSISVKQSFLQRFFFAFVAALMTMAAFGQEGDKKVDINVSTEKDNFWASPWVWVVGAAVFILLLVAIMKSGSSKGA